MEAWLMHRAFAVQSGWEDASALPWKDLTQLKTPSAFPAENFLELYLFVYFTFTVKGLSLRMNSGRFGSLS